MIISTEEYLGASRHPRIVDGTAARPPSKRGAADGKTDCEGHGEILARPDIDPLLSYDSCAADAGVSIATFKRNILPHLAVVQITARLRGVRRSTWDAYKTSRTRKPLVKDAA